MKSRILEDYEILLRKDSGEFIGYCPQINLMFRDKSKDLVIEKIKNAISEYIRTIPLTDDEKELEELISFEKQKAKDKLLDSLKIDKNVEEANQNINSYIEEKENKSSDESKNIELIESDISTEELDGLFLDINRAI